jgi:hypothetical protein
MEINTMNDATKTGIFAAVAAATSLLAWMTTTRNYTTGQNEATARVNQVLFDTFNDPLSAASLKIVKYDADTERYQDFEVAKDRKSGVWTIPSHENYPADANKQMSDAANLFVGLKALNVASTKRDEQMLFGVVEPDKKKEAEGGEGVGQLVQFRDDKGDMLVDLIIGKSDAQDPKKRFVRIPSEDVIYVVELETNGLSTDFKQWIESDLLKLSSNDIETIGIRNYTLEDSGRGVLRLNPIYDADVSFGARDGRWQAKNFSVYEDKKPKPRALAESEELNGTKLNDMKSALDNLRIVNVSRKPPGVAADLKADTLQEATLAALTRRGFYASRPDGSGAYELFAMNGDLQVTLKDGVQYLLRFGNPAGASFESADPDENSQDPNAEKEVSLNRFLLVSARLDESKFPQPVLERVPETVEELKALEAAKKAILNPPVNPLSGGSVPSSFPLKPPADNPAEPATNPEPGQKETTPSADQKPEPETSAAGTPEPAGEKAVEAETPAVEPPKEVNEEPKTVRFNGRRESATARFVSAQNPVASPDAVKPAGNQPPELSDDEWKERLEAERERINKENKRKIDLRNDRMEVAKKRVAELNARFADWYYIVSDAEFKRLKIEISDLVTKKNPGQPNLPQSGLPGNLPGLNIPGLSDQ